MKRDQALRDEAPAGGDVAGERARSRRSAWARAQIRQRRAACRGSPRSSQPGQGGTLPRCGPLPLWRRARVSPACSSFWAATAAWPAAVPRATCWPSGRPPVARRSEAAPARQAQRPHGGGRLLGHRRHQRQQRRPDLLGQRRLGRRPQRQRRRRRRTPASPALRSLPNPSPAAPTSLATTTSQRFSAAWPAPAPPGVRRSPRRTSAAKPTRSGPPAAPPRARPELGQQIGVGDQAPAPATVGLPAGDPACPAPARPGGSRRPRPPSPPRRRPRRRPRPAPPASRSALSTSIRRPTPPGVASDTGPAISVTSAPSCGGGRRQREAHLPRRPVAQEAHVVDRLVGRARR